MKKYFFATVGALVLLLAFGNGNTFAQTTFKDVNSQYWAKGQIDYLAEKKIISGYPDDTFKPNNQLTRAQAAKMLVKALKLSTANRPATSFKDIPTGHQAYNAIATIADEGLMGGTNGYFRPNETLTRAQMAAILTKAFKLKEGSSYKIFNDVSTKHWAHEKIHLLSSNRISLGYSDGTFRPNKPTSRAQFSVFLSITLYPDLFQPKDREKVTREANGQFTYYGSWIYYNGGVTVSEKGIFRKKLDGSQYENLLEKDSLTIWDSVRNLDIENDKIYYSLHSVRNNKSSLYKMNLNGENKELIELPETNFHSFEVEGKWLYLEIEVNKETPNKMYRLNLETKETTLLNKDLNTSFGNYFVSEEGLYLPDQHEFYPISSSNPETFNLKDISSITGVKDPWITSNFYVDRGNLYYTVSAVNSNTKDAPIYLIKYNESTKKRNFIKINKPWHLWKLVNIYDGYSYFEKPALGYRYFEENISKIYRIPLSGGSLEYVADIPNISFFEVCGINWYKVPGAFSIIGGKTYFYKKPDTGTRCQDA